MTGATARRDWLKLAAAAGTSSLLWGQRPRFDSYPFALGVVSGDPLPDGVVLWTRIMVDPSAGPVVLQWDVSADEGFRTVVKHGQVVARPERAHCVHVDVRGLLPRRPYWYRFRAGGPGAFIESPVGRTITAPVSSDPVKEPYRFAFASCQKYEDGYYTAWQHLARDEDLQMVLFLGDYIYQGAAKTGMPRPHPSHEAMTLEDYRQRYALYRSDPDLQRAHQLFPWMVVWDDHELCNDYSGQAAERDPQLRRRRDAAYQAFFEHMPLRGGWSRPLYRDLQIGRLAQLTLLDTRRYKSPLACGEGVKPRCQQALESSRTMLGKAQEEWLYRKLRTSTTPWQIVAQQIPFALVDREPGVGVSLHMDKWGGYPAARERLLRVLEERGRQDTVILTGDNHNAWVMNVAREDGGEDARALATEFVCTSISSTGDGSPQRKEYARLLSENPHARYLNSRRGYSRCVVTPLQWRTDFLTVPWVTRPGAGITVDASFVLKQGSTVVERG